MKEAGSSDSVLAKAVHETEYLRFVDVAYQHTRKTGTWLVQGQRGDHLGVVQWFGRWRQYAFFPTAGTAFNFDCLDDIQKFLAQQNHDHRQELRRRREGEK